MKQWYRVLFKNDRLKYICYINLIIILGLLTSLFFIPYARVNIPTSSAYEFMKIQDGTFTIPVYITLAIITLFTFIFFNDHKLTVKAAKWLVFCIVILILTGLLQIHLAENGHAGNLIFKFSFHVYNFQPGSFIVITLLILYIINLYCMKKLFTGS